MQRCHNSQKLDSLSKWRKILFPVTRSELPRFVSLCSLKFIVCFIFTILHAVKDTVIITAHGAGVEAIPVLKGGVVFIAAFFMTIVYSKLSNQCSRNAVFYVLISGFLLFFLLYGHVLYPYSEWLIPHQSADRLLSLLGESHKHWVSVYRYWMDSLLFVGAELWGGVGIGLLFWGFANQICNVGEAARFYMYYTAGGNVGTVLAGLFVYQVTTHYGTESFQATIATLMNFVVFSLLCMTIIYWLTTRHLKKINHTAQNTSQVDFSASNQPTQLSFLESLQHILRSPYLAMILIMVMGYSLTVNLVEVTFKAVLKVQYPVSADYAAAMGILQTIVGSVSLFIAVVFGGYLIRKLGWKLSALLTPIAMGVLSIAFFVVYLVFPDFIVNKSLYFGLSPLFLLILFGGLHNICSKAMKYSIFDPTKEMAYIPLDQESKVKGKAAVDLLGGRFGKSGASWLLIIALDLFATGSILDVFPVVIPIVLLGLIGWMFAIIFLNRQFNRAVDEQKPVKQMQKESTLEFEPKTASIAPA